MAGYFVGIDIGSTMTKVVLMNGGVIASILGSTGPEQRRLAHRVMERTLDEASLPFEAITYIVATGYGRINVPFADRQITEISCHARGVAHFFPEAALLIDIGGQDSKGIKIAKGRPVDFVMNDKCAAGSGRFLEIIADALGVPLGKMGETALKSTRPVPISNICTVFAEQEVASKLAEGVPLNDLVAGIIESLATRVARMVQRLHPAGKIVITGGGATNRGLVESLSRFLGTEVLVPEAPLFTGAIGAALLGKDAVRRAGEKGVPLTRSPRVLREVELF